LLRFFKAQKEGVRRDACVRTEADWGPGGQRTDGQDKSQLSGSHLTLPSEELVDAKIPSSFLFPLPFFSRAFSSVDRNKGGQEISYVVRSISSRPYPELTIFPKNLSTPSFVTKIMLSSLSRLIEVP